MPKILPIAPLRATSPQMPTSNVNASLPGEAAAQFGQSVSNVGAGLSDLAQKQREVQLLTDVTKRKTDAALATDQFIRSQEDNPNLDFSKPEQSQAYIDGVTKGLDQIMTSTLQGVKDPKARAVLQDALYTQRETAIINSRSFSHNRMTEAGRGELARSLDADWKIGVDATGPQLDAIVSDVPARLLAAEHAGLITSVQRQTMSADWLDKLQAVRIDRQIQANPDQAIADLKDDAHFGNVDPAKRQNWLDQAVNEKARQQEQARKAADDARETAVATMESQALAGGLTHAALEDNRQKLNLKPQEYEHLYDLINKPAQELPSDTKTHNSMSIAVQLSPPTVTQQQLYKSYLDYQAGKPGLNLADFTELNGKLKEGLRVASAPDSAANQRKSLALSIVDKLTSADPTINAAARTDLANSPAFQTGLGDPIATANEIGKKYEPAISSLEGQSLTAVQGRFRSARNAYEGALKAQANWNSSLRNKINPFTSNPNDAAVETKKAEFLDAARVAKRDLGPAPPHAIEGTRKVIPPALGGGTSVIIGGRIIKQ